jgi:3D (Asp-Asp-Asp) domain-containing protein
VVATVFTASARTTSTVLVTAYCQTGRTASGELTRPGIIASRSPIPFGTIVRIAGETYTVEDRMARDDRASIDIYMTELRRRDRLGHPLGNGSLHVPEAERYPDSMTSDCTSSQPIVT